MKKEITFKQYKAIDISILSVLLLLFEALSVYASSKWFNLAGLTLISLTPLVMVVMMMRWSEFAVIAALVGGVSYCFACGGKPEQYLIYCVGNLFGILSIFIIKKLGKEAIREKQMRLALISVSTYLFINVGRWLVSLIFAPAFETLITFVTTDAISLIVAIVGTIALRNSDGILEDQKAYLLRLDRERREEEERRAKMSSGIYNWRDEDEEDDFDDLPEDDDSDIIWDEPDPACEYEPDAPSEEERLSPPDIAEEIPAREDDSADTPVAEPDEAEQETTDNNNDEFISEDKI